MGGGGGAALETPPHLEWKGCVLIVNCHHFHPPQTQCRAPCMQVNWGGWMGGGGQPLRTPPHLEWKVCILIGGGIGMGGGGGQPLGPPPN